MRALKKNKGIIFVDTAVSSSGNGSIYAPFSTVENAQSYIASEKSQGSYPKNGYTVYLREGIYENMNLTQSGEENAPITYTAYNNESVTVNGGTELDFSDFTLANDENISDSAKGKIYKYNLKEHGISDYGELQVTGHGLYYLSKAGITGGVKPVPVVLFDGVEGTLARYPNVGYMTVGSVIEAGNMTTPTPMTFTVSNEQVSKWANAKNPWVTGYWRWDYSDLSMPIKSIDTQNNSITTKYPSPFSTGVISGQRFYIYNLLEELDTAGEWYYDKDSGDFYVYAQNETDVKKITLGFSSDNLLDMKNVKNIEISKINFKGTRGSGANINNCRNIVVEDCVFSNASGSGAGITDSDCVTIRNCEFYSIGSTGVSVSGGNTTTLTPANNVIESCKIHDFAKTVKTYTPGIRVSGVGQIVRNNTVFDGPHAGIIFGGNDNVIENNEIYSVVKEAADMGAVYCGGSMTARGNIVKNNYIHSISSSSSLGGQYGIYLDSCFSGTTVTNNRIEDINGSGIMINAGRNNTITDNNLKNLKTGIILYPCGRAVNWYNGQLPSLSTFGLEGDSIAPFTSEAYSKYPNMNNILNDNPLDPKYNVITGNVGENVEDLLSMNIQGGGSTLTDEEFYSWNTIQGHTTAD